MISEPKLPGGVLVVDDDELAREVVVTLLQRAVPGLRVRAAVSGDEAWRLFQTERPAIVVTDLRMPGMSGGDLIQAIRELDAEMPVFAITGAPDPVGVPGATEVILKTEFQVLIRRVSGLVQATG